MPCGGVPTLPSGHLSLVVIQACAGLPIKHGPTVNPEGSSVPEGLALLLRITLQPTPGRAFCFVPAL